MGSLAELKYPSNLFPRISKETEVKWVLGHCVGSLGAGDWLALWKATWRTEELAQW